jgi:ATP-binding cassette subfamily C protein
MKAPTPRSAQGEIATVIDKGLKAIKPALMGTIVFSFFINLLGLVSPIYMMQVYDRVLSSRSISTLLFLTLILAFFYAVIALLEMVRSRVLIRAGVKFDRVVNPEVFRAIQKFTLRKQGTPPTQALRDLDSIREFLTGSGFLSFLDFPWVPLYVAASFLINFWFGIFVIVAAIITFTLALLNEVTTKERLNRAQNDAIKAGTHANTTFRNAEVLHAMGMVEPLRERWSKHHESVLAWQAAASNKAGLIVALAKFHRMLTQSLVLGLGAYLVLERQITPGMMIAASIIVGRALQPVEIAIGNWKGFTNMRSAYARVQGLLREFAPEPNRMPLPRPKGHLAVENIIAFAPGRNIPILKNISVNIPAGAAVGIIGPSAAGKSSLARVMTGIWPAAQGHVRIDGNEINHWDQNDLGKHIGYLPQDVELFAGTIAENIARFSEIDDAQIIAAAVMAGVHEMIQRMPEGYNTQIGDGGQALSGGQRQRIGLARALYSDPSIIILDEPNANLDTAGEEALVEALRKLKEQRRTVVVVTHKMNILSFVDFILVLQDGVVQMGGPRDEILSKLMTPKVVPGQGDQQHSATQQTPHQQNAPQQASQQATGPGGQREAV